MEETGQFKEVIASLNTKRKQLINHNGMEKKICHNSLEMENGVFNSYTTDQETLRVQTKRKCRTKLDAFLFQNPNKMISHNSNHNNNNSNKEKTSRNEGIDSDSEHKQNQDLLIPIKRPKKAPANSEKCSKISGKSKASSSNKRKEKKSKSSERSKKSQISIKSAFWLSSGSSQSSSIKDIEEQELQLALNISSVEYENVNRSSIHTTQDSDNEYLGKDRLKTEKESLRDKLQMYGFRKATKQDYELVANNFRPKITNNQKKKCAWINKYTALTLRNTDQQYKKLTDNIQSTITASLRYINNKNKQNSIIRQSFIDQSNEYELISPMLKSVRCQYLNIFKHKCQQELSAYYVDELFEIKLGNKYSLLKDWSKIPGRTDLSPVKASYENQECTRKLHLNEMVPNSKEERLLNVSAEENLACDINSDLQKQSSHEQMHDINGDDKDIYSSETITLSANSNAPESAQTPTKTHYQVFGSQSITSPDLFADTDDENNEENIKEVVIATNEMNATDREPNNIEKPQNTDELNTIVDLTQEDSNSLSEEILFSGKNEGPVVVISDNIILVEDTHDLSMKIPNVQTDIDTNYDNDNGIFEKLREKYLFQTSQNSCSNTPNVAAVMQPEEKTSYGIDNNESKSSMSSQCSTDNDNEFALSDDEINYSIRKAQLITNSSRLIKKSSHGKEDYGMKDYERSETTTSTRRCLEFELEHDLVSNNSSYDNNLSSNSGLSTKSNCQEIQTSFTSYLCEDIPSSPENPFLSPNYLKTSEVREKNVSNNMTAQNSELSSPNSTHSDDEFDRLVMKYGKGTEQKQEYLEKTNKNLMIEEFCSDYPQEEEDILPCVETDCTKFSQDTQSNFTPINENILQNSEEKISYNDKDFEKVIYNGRVYLVRYCTSPKPDYVNMDENEILKHLYKYGLKKMKRTQAIKILEYLYNQTHPLIEDSDEEQSTEEDSDSFHIGSNSKNLQSPQETDTISNLAKNTIVLKDASGTEMLKYRDELQLEFINEDYIFQTNITKKTLRPLLPLHVAWYNLICSNPSLHEAVLMYEPIDLQDIYLFWKNIGYRYNPKELKIFFDKRSIIFRYDVLVSSNSNQAA